MKNYIFLVFLTAVTFFGSENIFAQKIYVPDTTLTHHERKAAKKEFLIEQLAHSKRLIIKADFLFADLETNLTFHFPKNILSANIGLESNLGLPDKRMFFVGSVLYRFSPSSGIYAQYYGINRETSGTTDQDYIFLGDTIQAGTKHTTFFNTQVISVGYILSIMQHQKAYLGVYFNVYLMAIKTGIRAETTQKTAELEGLLPLPNFGIVGSVELKKWLGIGGDVGFFGISTKSFGGHVTSFAFEVTFKPIHWLGIDVKYQTFDINVNFPEESSDVNIEYKFHGPALGLTLMF